MLHIHKNVDGTYWIDLKVINDGKTVISFSGNFQRLGDEEGESDNTLNLTIPTIGD